eukprot:7376437-Prymnesium_polylepis.1
MDGSLELSVRRMQAEPQQRRAEFWLAYARLPLRGLAGPPRRSILAFEELDQPVAVHRIGRDDHRLAGQAELLHQPRVVNSVRIFAGGSRKQLIERLLGVGPLEQTSSLLAELRPGDWSISEDFLQGSRCVGDDGRAELRVRARVQQWVQGTACAVCAVLR